MLYTFLLLNVNHAFSASSSSVSVSGRRWLLQHRDRRLLFPEAVAPSAPLAPAGFSSYSTSIYESEPLLSNDDVAVVSWIPVPKEKGMEARALRGSNGASPTRVS
ncbi:hypothetical protein DY000_02028119 [Brassica cretica]|uniref:Secreted protein n=1 Tax=Brassica cretica TaxID=69181 RepID=A0ABQ7E111_BRACR|nr:hypothetical protein DY000_02028119 [Brassica cretica]